MYNNGNCYNGQWENDLISGKRTMTYRDEGQYEGVWKIGTVSRWKIFSSIFRF